MTKSAYSQDGVDVAEEALFSSFAGSICKASYNNSPFVEILDLSGGNFRGARPFSLKNLPADILLEASTDGIGTKGILHDAAKTHSQAAYDIIAMTASDITRFGGVPLIFINVFDIVSVGKTNDTVSQTYKSTMEGLGQVAKKAKIVVLKGETAQMGIAVGSEMNDSQTKFNWSGTMIGAYHKNKMITGDSLAEGQIIIALKENGFRCNGISAVRASLKAKFGNDWWSNSSAQESIKQAATPSVLYDIFINTLHGWYSQDFKPEVTIHALVHLSGGAFKEKLAKDILFPRGLSANLNALWEPPDIMTQCAKWHGISDEEFYEVWNGGQGMLMVINEKDVNLCLKRASEFGIQAKVAGKISKGSKPKVSINSQLTKDKTIIYG